MPSATHDIFARMESVAATRYLPQATRHACGALLRPVGPTIALLLSALRVSPVLPLSWPSVGTCAQLLTLTFDRVSPLEFCGGRICGHYFQDAVPSKDLHPADVRRGLLRRVIAKGREFRGLAILQEVAGPRSPIADLAAARPIVHGASNRGRYLYEPWQTAGFSLLLRGHACHGDGQERQNAKGAGDLHFVPTRLCPLCVNDWRSRV